MANLAPEKTRLARWLSAGAAVLLLVLASGIWLARDAPRRSVERLLAERLGAEVHVGGLAVDGLHDFVLREVEIHRMPSVPRLDRVRVATIGVRGSVPAFLDGRFDMLRLSGLEVRLVPPPPGGPPPPVGEPVRAFVGRLEVEDGRLVAAEGGAESAFDFTASFSDVGGNLAGEARARAGEVSLAPALAVLLGEGTPLPFERGRIEGLEASVRVSGGGRSASLDASARSVRLRKSGRDLEIPSPSLHADLRQAAPGAPLSIELKPVLPFVESLDAFATVDSKSGRLIGARASAKGIDIEAAAGLVTAMPEGWSARGRADLTVSSEGPSNVTYDLVARIDRASFETKETAIGAEGATLWALGTARIEHGNASGPLRVDLSLPRVSGRANGLVLPAGALPIRCTLDARVEAAEAIGGDGTLGIETGGAGKLEAKGTARLSAAGSDVSVRWSWTGLDLEKLAALAREAGATMPAAVAVRGSVTAEGTLSGSLAAPAIEGRVEVASLQLDTSAGAGATARALSLSEGRAGARLAWRSPAGPIEIALLEAGGSVAVPPLAPFPASLAARGAIATAPLALRLDRADLDAPGLARLTASGEASLEGEPRGTMRAHVEGIDLARWQSFLRPVVGDPAPGYSVRGSADADVGARLDPAGRLAVSGTAGVRKSGFASEDGAKVLEGLDTSWDISLEAGKGDPALVLRARAPVGGFQLLWGSFFLDGSGLTSSLEAEARATRDGSAGGGALRWNGTAAWTLPDGPRVEATIDLPPSGPATGTLDLAVADLGATVDRYLRAKLADAAPFFRRIEASGSLHAALRATLSSGARAVSGSVEAKGVRIAGTGGYAEVDGLDLDFPIDLAWGAPGPDGSRPLSGAAARASLRFARATVGGIEFPPTATGLAVEADSVALEEKLAVPILGGDIGLERLRLLDLLRPARRVETGIRLSRIDLGETARSLGFLPLEGTVDGYLPAVRISPSDLHVEGGGEISIFGGRVSIGDISGKDVLSRYPKLVFSASFRDVDLGRLTRRFDFGEMTGTVEGSVKDCELFRGVPVRFGAEVRTVERKGVPRTINVKAINNIAILGTGGRVNVFDRGIHRFFNRYTYEALGIRLSLENDVFLLRGLEHRGERELFLKGRLPLRIDVVNVQPGKTVSFRTMLERVRALDFATATTGP